MVPSRSGSERLPFPGGLVLALLTLLLFTPALAPDATFFFRDVSLNHLPFRKLMLSMGAAGDLPLWNPMRGAGQPFLANPNALILHPTTLLFLVFPLHWAMKLSVILQVMLAGFGTWLVLRDLGARRAGAFAGAAVFAFSGYVVSLGSLLNLLNSAAFMPLTLWLAGRAVHRGFAPWGSLAALSLAVQILAGEPAMLLATFAAMVPMLAGALSPPAERPAPARAPKLAGVRIAILAGVVLLAMALSLVGLLPAIELLGQSERGEGFDPGATLEWSLPPISLLTVIFPGLLGDPTCVDAARWWGGQYFDNGIPLILSLYLGPAALLAGMTGLRAGWRDGGKRRLEAAALGALILAGVALALGRYFGPSALLIGWVPGLSSIRFPVKLFLMATWGAALLAGRGVDALMKAAPERRAAPARGILPGLAAGGLLLAVGLMVVSWMDAAGPREAMRAAVLHASLVAGVAAALIVRRGRWAGPLLAALCVADLLWMGVPVNPVAPSSFYDEPPLLARALGPPSPGGRIWSRLRPKGFAYRPPPWDDPGLMRPAYRWDRMTLRNATGFELGYRFAYDRGSERLDVLPGAALGQRLYEELPAPLPPEQVARLLAVASVDRAIVYGAWQAPGWTERGRVEDQSSLPVVVMQSREALPRTYVVHRAETIPDTTAALSRLRHPSFDPQSSVILDAPFESSELPAPVSEGLRRARIVSEGAMTVRVAVQDGPRGYLVLTDTWYPGWEATLDAEIVPVRRANGMFRAVMVPAGSHDVVFLYRPASVRRGLVLTMLALGLATILALPFRRSRSLESAA